MIPGGWIALLASCHTDSVSAPLLLFDSRAPQKSPCQTAILMHLTELPDIISDQDYSVLSSIAMYSFGMSKAVL